MTTENGPKKEFVSNWQKKIFLLIFCLASVAQGMYSTYFVSILTTLERIYQIQSKTAGAILSATEIGQIIGSLLIAYYGGRGNKSKWIATCMTLSAIAALISISPHLIMLTSNNHKSANKVMPTAQSASQSLASLPMGSALLTNSPHPSDLNKNLSHSIKDKSMSLILSPGTRAELPDLNNLCQLETSIKESITLSPTHQRHNDSAPAQPNPDSHRQSTPVNLILLILFVCLLVIGFGSTSITTLGIPLIDDIVSKEESPLYLGLSIGLRVAGPALGFLLGSFCIQIDSSRFIMENPHLNGSSPLSDSPSFAEFARNPANSAWWLGLVIISLPLIIFALPMYYLSRAVTEKDREDSYGDITYQAAEDHDIGGSHDFQPHILGFADGDLDVTSNKTCLSSDVDSSSREVLRGHNSALQQRSQQFIKNMTNERRVYAKNCILGPSKLMNDIGISNNLVVQDNESTLDPCNETDIDNWRSDICVVVNHFGGMESARFMDDQKVAARDMNRNTTTQTTCEHNASTSRSSIASLTTANSSSYVSSTTIHHDPAKKQSTIADLSTTLSRLIKNRLLLLRMLSGTLHILPVAGFYTFFPKYLMEQFRITSSSASLISGLAGVLFVGFGALIGGIIVRVFNVNSRLVTKWIASSALLYTIGMIMLLNLGCPTNQTFHYGSEEYMSTDCSISCKCSTDIYSPVCANGTTYISPCLAGCKSYSITGERVIFDECGCSSARATDALKNITDSVAGQSAGPNDQHVNLNVATQGHCLVHCDNLKWYIIIFSISTLIHASCEVGSTMFNLRCVNSNDRTLALGLITFSSSLLGTIPCSVLYGTIVDLTCVHWGSIFTNDETIASSTKSHGACQAYENDSFRIYLHGLTAFVMFFAFIVDLIVSRYANEVEFYDNESVDSSELDVTIKKIDKSGGTCLFI